MVDSLPARHDSGPIWIAGRRATLWVPAPHFHGDKLRGSICVLSQAFFLHGRVKGSARWGQRHTGQSHRNLLLSCSCRSQSGMVAVKRRSTLQERTSAFVCAVERVGGPGSGGSSDSASASASACWASRSASSFSLRSRSAAICFRRSIRMFSFALNLAAVCLMIAWYSSGSMEFFPLLEPLLGVFQCLVECREVWDVGWVVGVYLRSRLFCANPLRLLDDRLYLFPDPGPVFLFFFGVGVGLSRWRPGTLLKGKGLRSEWKGVRSESLPTLPPLGSGLRRNDGGRTTYVRILLWRFCRSLY